MLAVRRKGVVRTKLEQRTPVGLVPKRACTERSCSIRVLFASWWFRKIQCQKILADAILVSNNSFFYKDFGSAPMKPIYAECARPAHTVNRASAVAHTDGSSMPSARLSEQFCSEQFCSEHQFNFY